MDLKIRTFLIQANGECGSLESCKNICIYGVKLTIPTITDLPSRKQKVVRRELGRVEELRPTGGLIPVEEVFWHALTGEKGPHLIRMHKEFKSQEEKLQGKRKTVSRDQPSV